MPTDYELGEIYDDGAPLEIAPNDPPLDVYQWVHIGLYVQPFLKRAAIGAALHTECESPIEVQLGIQLVLLIGEAYQIVPQFKFGKYRIDFAVVPLRQSIPVLFIECDGAEFHSTAEQIANDRRKDAKAQEAGVKLVRFTGKEIYHSAEACALYVQELIESGDA